MRPGLGFSKKKIPDLSLSFSASYITSQNLSAKDFRLRFDLNLFREIQAVLLWKKSLEYSFYAYTGFKYSRALRKNFVFCSRKTEKSFTTENPGASKDKHLELW